MLLKWQLNYIFIDQMWARLCQGSVFGRAKVALLGARMGSGSEVCSKIWCEKSIGYVWLHIYLDFQLTYHIFGFPLWTSPSFLEHKGSLFQESPLWPTCVPGSMMEPWLQPTWAQWWIGGPQTCPGWNDTIWVTWTWANSLGKDAATKCHQSNTLGWIIIIFLIKMAVIWGHIWVYQTDKPKSSYKKVQADKALHVPAPKLRSCAFPCFRRALMDWCHLDMAFFISKPFLVSYYHTTR